MTRGIPSKKALEAAFPIACARGVVMFFRQDAMTPGDFLLITPEGLILVRVCRTRNLYNIYTAIEIQFRERLALLRSAVIIPEISRELWLWSPYGSMRFFRVEEQELIELDRYGHDYMKYPGKTAPR